MPTRNGKPWLSVDEQLAQLAERGMAITDPRKAREVLERIGYYRLSGYWFDLRVRDVPFCPLDPATGRKPKRVVIERPVLDEFKPGTRFQDAVGLYVFDKKLRLLAMDALERIEIALRVDLSHSLGKTDRFAFFGCAAVSPHLCQSAHSIDGGQCFHVHRGQHSKRWRTPCAGVLSDGANRIPTVRDGRGMGQSGCLG